ncbi:Rieske (2Fe-2S) protein [Halorussus halophilus]|uniref:Rieske (2Fe-2S) protein n=1 Tax=Halorussus halophilus TaxID=2650975 RepID=UPI0013015720|nr:(2Fe-2S)-binding protein [Halorussus halophilus]
MSTDRRITSVDEVPDDSTFLFRVRNSETDEQKEVILLRLGGEESSEGDEADDKQTDGGEEIVGWFNYCQHFTHIKLDKGEGAPMRDGEVICANHGAWFESNTGYCSFGPCEGAYLNEVEVTVEDGDVYLADEDYEFVGLGPEEKDDFDLTSKSNIEF